MATRADEIYVSEFTEFMDGYLKKHPEVVEDQQRGWNIYWNPKVDLAALKEAEENSVPDDEYGFAWLAWRVKPSPAKQPAKPAAS